MSKSKGNVVAPSEVAKKFGTEILRLWVALSDYQNDLKIGDEILKQIAEQYRKTRNTIRFLLANINDLESIMPAEEMGTLDRWIIAKAKTVFDEVDTHFKNYDFAKGLSLLNHFITAELSGIHMDISKDRLYCNTREDTKRRSAQSAMAEILTRMLALLAPVLSYTVDEVLEYAPDVVKQDAEDLFDLLYAPLPEVESDFDEAYMTEAREKFFEIVDALKKEKKIKSTLELALWTDSGKIAALDPTDAEDWFTVSEIGTDVTGEKLDTFSVEGDTFTIMRSTKAKCPRCWKQKSLDEESLCERCSEVVG